MIRIQILCWAMLLCLCIGANANTTFRYGYAAVSNDTIVPTPKDSVHIPKDSVKTSVGYTTPAPANLIPQITPKSPVAASLGRYGEYPVSLYTGLPTIEIPLYEIKVGAITIPIKLTYHAAGHKVNDRASWVGLGWSLQTGGIVSRQIQGIADEKASTGVLNKAIKTPYEEYGINCMTPQVEQMFGNLVDGLWDGQRDLFSYQLPTASNTFILTPSKVVQQVPSGVKVAAASFPTQIDITDESGTLFRFAAGEEASAASYSCTTSWLPTDIISATSQDRVTYSYTTVTMNTFTPDLVDVIYVNSDFEGNGTMPPDPTGTTIDRGSAITQRFPTAIRFPGGQLTFEFQAYSVGETPVALDKIHLWHFNVISQQYQRVRSFDLNYEQKARIGGSLVLFLNQVRLLDSNSSQVGSYSISYNSTQLPQATSKNTDYWGYANGASNSTRIPTFTIQHRQAAGGPSTSRTLGGANREVSETSMKAWCLTRISYPTGGYTEFDFEANRYQKNGLQHLAGGLRIKQIRNYTGVNVLSSTKTYKYGTGEDGFGKFRSNIQDVHTSKQINNNNTGYTPTNYSYLVTTYTSAPTYPLSPQEGSPVTYSMVAEYEDNGAGAIGRTIYEFRDGLDDVIYQQYASGATFVHSNHWSRGQLMRKRAFAANGQIRSMESTYYGTYGGFNLNERVGLLIARTKSQLSPPQGSPCYSVSNEYDGFIAYNFSGGLVKEFRKEVYQYADDFSQQFTLTTTETDYVHDAFVPAETRLKAPGGITLGTRYIYPQNFGDIPPNSSSELLGVQALKNRNMYIPLETVSYRLEGTYFLVTGGQVTTYTPKTLNGFATALPYKSYQLTSEYNSFGSLAYTSIPEATTLSTGNLTVDSRYILRLTRTTYDTYGNLLSYTQSRGSTTALNYATYTPAGGVAFSTPTSMTLNTGQPTAQTTNYYYNQPLLGPWKVSDPRNNTTQYEYDTFGRLGIIRDNEGNILKQYTYHYATQP